jgi:hypothetical protein
MEKQVQSSCCHERVYVVRAVWGVSSLSQPACLQLYSTIIPKSASNKNDNKVCHSNHGHKPPDDVAVDSGEHLLCKLDTKTSITLSTPPSVFLLLDIFCGSYCNSICCYISAFTNSERRHALISNQVGKNTMW